MSEEINPLESTTDMAYLLHRTLNENELIEEVMITGTGTTVTVITARGRTFLIDVTEVE